MYLKINFYIAVIEQIVCNTHTEEMNMKHRQDTIKSKKNQCSLLSTIVSGTKIVPDVISPESNRCPLHSTATRVMTSVPVKTTSEKDQCSLPSTFTSARVSTSETCCNSFDHHEDFSHCDDPPNANIDECLMPVELSGKKWKVNKELGIGRSVHQRQNISFKIFSIIILLN